MNIDKKLNLLDLFLKGSGIFFKKDYLLKYNTYFKMGGVVKFFVEPQSCDHFFKTINYLKEERLRYKILGATSNVLLFDDISYSIILSTKNLTRIELANTNISVEAGYSLQEFVRVMVINDIIGFEGLEGIPASMGGAVLMNAGAYGYSISDNLISVVCIDESGRYIELSKEDCEFDYRSSVFRSGKYTILKACFRIQKGCSKTIAKRVERFHIARHSYQEFAYPNLGSLISIPSNFYQQIFDRNRKYLCWYWILKLLFKNPVAKFVKRKRPESIVFNKLLFKYINKEYNYKINYKPSKKGANILLNSGNNTLIELLTYMKVIDKLIGSDFHIENEVVVEPRYDINADFKEEFKYIIERFTFVKDESDIA